MHLFGDTTSLTSWRDGVSGSVGFVPTMGALHEGHLSLVRAARSQCDQLVVSIYVNPLQFGQGEDFESYPRDISADAALLAPLGVEVVFHPETLEERGQATRIVNDELASRWCGASRSGHFDGVLTVVSKLFNLVRPTDAWFGQKDYQQLSLIRCWAEEQYVPVNIHGHPIARDSDGLALSSRNQYLNGDQRNEALGLNRALRALSKAYKEGLQDRESLLSIGRKCLLGLEIEYFDLVDPLTLIPVKSAQRGSVALVAAKIGSTRLIDNLILDQVN